MSKRTIKDILTQSYDNSIQHLRKCDYCRGKDGKGKDIYESFQKAYDTTKFVEESRNIYLNVYKCPYGNGWHLTKNNASTGIIERKDTLFQNSDIPLKSSDGLWEFVKDELDNSIEENKLDETENYLKREIHYQIPIKKIECKTNNEIIEIKGKIMEIYKNVNIGNIFKINIENAFCISLAKNILDGIVDQVTIYVENYINKQYDSYTVLIKRDFLNEKIVKGFQIKICIVTKTINNIQMWCCRKVLE
ncbi:MAG: hypothetical protein FWD36_09515 [Treponema sp.]|nr:hypothetical protein [Treponema sp.]